MTSPTIALLTILLYLALVLSALAFGGMALVTALLLLGRPIRLPGEAHRPSRLSMDPPATRAPADGADGVSTAPPNVGHHAQDRAEHVPPAGQAGSP